MLFDCEGDPDSVLDKQWADPFPSQRRVTGGSLCSQRPHCAPIRAERWVVCPSTADLGLGLRKAAHPYQFQRVKPKAPATRPAAALHAQRHLLFDSHAKA